MIARLIQGFSAGGEVGASTTLLLERAAEPAWPVCIVAIRQPGTCSTCRRIDRCCVDRNALERTTRKLGMARAVPDRHADRAGGLVAAQDARRRTGAHAQAESAETAAD